MNPINIDHRLWNDSNNGITDEYCGGSQTTMWHQVGYEG